MAGKQERSKSIQLVIVLDTSALYTGSASDLLNNEMGELIEESARHHDVEISWHLPAMVRDERMHQMVSAGEKLLPSIEKLERLLGHNLNITPEIIRVRVKETIQYQIDKLGLVTDELDVTGVDWSSLVHNAVNRTPPFSSGEHEKGFRDAVILETLAQIVESSPVDSRTCRLRFMTADDLLIQAAQSRLGERQNFKCLTGIQECKALINVLASTVTEEYVEGILESARRYFFDKDNRAGMWYSENIRNQITEEFSSELTSLPSGADYREDGTWHISNPSFIRKEKQVVYWSSRVTVSSKAYKRDILDPYGGTRLNLGGGVFSTSAGDILGQGRLLTPEELGIERIGSTGFLGQVFPERKGSRVADCESVFEVTWRVTVSTNHKLSRGAIESIQFIETEWR